METVQRNADRRGNAEMAIRGLAVIAFAATVILGPGSSAVAAPPLDDPAETAPANPDAPGSAARAVEQANATAALSNMVADLAARQSLVCTMMKSNTRAFEFYQKVFDQLATLPSPAFAKLTHDNAERLALNKKTYEAGCWIDGKDPLAD